MNLYNWWLKFFLIFNIIIFPGGSHSARQVSDWFPQHGEESRFTGYLQVGHQATQTFHTLRPRQNGRHFADDIFTWIFVNENIWILIKISLKFVPKGIINYIASLVQIMAWRRPGDKPLSEPLMVNLLTHIYVTRPQWVKSLEAGIF